MSPADVTPPQQSLKKALAASWAELAQDFKALGLTPNLSKPQSGQLGRKRLGSQMRGRRAREVKTEDLAPFLGLQSFIAEADLKSRDHVPWPILPIHRSGPNSFQPGRLRRSATHAAIAYFIWQCFQAKQSLHVV